MKPSYDLRMLTRAAGLGLWIFAGPATVEATAAPIAVKIIPTNKSENGSIANPAACNFEDDRLSMVIKEEGKINMTQDFCSSYGKTKYSIFSSGVIEYIFLETYSGRGSNSTTTFLTIYRIDGFLDELARIPISWAVGPTSRFTYNYSAHIDKDNGISIRLEKTMSGHSECCVPSRSHSKVVLEYLNE